LTANVAFVPAEGGRLYLQPAEAGYRKETRAHRPRNAEKHFPQRSRAVSPAPTGNVGAIRALPARDNVNIQLGFVIANYFSLLRSLFATLSRRRHSRSPSPGVPAFPGESTNVPAAAPLARSFEGQVVVDSCPWELVLSARTVSRSV
jgi:hypothetical protein